MGEEKTGPDKLADLRERAEQALLGQPVDASDLSPKEVERLFHELRVHQIELEAQNEELLRAQRELEVSRERYFDLYDLAPVGYFTISEQGMILEANLTAANLLGVDRGSLVQRPVTHFITPEDQDIYYFHRKQLFETLSPQACEMRMVRGDGSQFWARIDAIVAQDGASESPVYRVTLGDITERKQTARALLEANARLQALQQAATAVHGSLDLQEVFQRITEGVVHSLGYTTAFILMLDSEGERLEMKAVSTRSQLLSRVGEVLGVPLDKFSFPADPDWNAVPRALMHGTSVVAGTLSEIAHSIIGKNTCMMIQKLTGTKCYVVVLLRVEGELVGGMVIASPQERVSEEELRMLEALAQSASNAIRNASLHAQARQAEADIARASEALRESERQFRTLAENAPAIVFRFDRELRHMYVNRAVEPVTGVPRSVFIGRTHREAGMPIDVATGWQEHIRQVFDTGEPLVYQFAFPSPDGQRHCESRLTPEFGEGGAVEFVMGVTTDVTERVRMDEELRESNRRLEKALADLREAQEQMMRRERLAAVGQLAAGIAHDFRSLMTAIILYAELPLRNLDLPPDLKQSLEAILGESRRAADLVQQILDFSRSSMIEVRPVDLEALAEGVLDVLQRTIPENIRLFVDVLPKDAPFVVQADPGRIEQALMNLSLNARDAMPRGGELRLGLSKMRLGPGDEPPVADMPAGEWVCLAVADTGIGMAEEVRAHLFEPFFTTKEVGEGTGLGLAQVYGIVRQHEGYIGVDTGVGQGTTFYVYLLACKAAETVAEEDASVTPRGQGEILLLVEDSDKLREAGRDVLESLGYRVLTSANGREALEVYRAEGGVALVVTDLVMPEMGGKELMQELRRLDPNLEALGLTGYAAGDVTSELRGVGFLDLVHKPFQVDVLARAIRRALDAHLC